MSYLQFRLPSLQLFGHQFRPSWLGTLITLCCIPLFIKLGLWQYHRAEQKQALQDIYENYQHAPPVALPLTITRPEDWRYRPVKVAGEYDTRYQILLDNQVEKGLVGYHVITPLRIDHTQTYVLVDRGWLPAQNDHSVLPGIASLAGQQEVTGKIWLPSAKFYSLESLPAEKPTAANWHTLWQNMDMQRYAAAVPLQLLPVVIRLDATSTAGGFVRDWPPPVENISTNIGYAYQWFGFAATALAIYLFVSFRKISNGDKNARAE